jgi:hypothetical protein
MYMYIVEDEGEANYEDKIRQKLSYLGLGLSPDVWGAAVMRQGGVEEASIDN